MDPRQVTTGPQARSANHSRLMAARARAHQGEKINLCPYGCADSETDDLGICIHLVGYTDDGKLMEPLITDERGRVKVRVPSDHEGGKERFRLVPVPTGATLERITTSSRVYHRAGRQPAQPKNDQAKKETTDGR